MPSLDIIQSVADANLKALGDVPAFATGIVTQFTAQSSGIAMENAVISNNIVNAIATTSAGVMVNQMQQMSGQLNALITELGTNKAILANSIGMGQSALSSTVLANKNTISGVEGDATALLGMIASIGGAVQAAGLTAESAAAIAVAIAEIVIKVFGK